MTARITCIQSFTAISAVRAAGLRIRKARAEPRFSFVAALEAAAGTPPSGPVGAEAEVVDGQNGLYQTAELAWNRQSCGLWIQTPCLNPGAERTARDAGRPIAGLKTWVYFQRS